MTVKIVEMVQKILKSKNSIRIIKEMEQKYLQILIALQKMERNKHRTSLKNMEIMSLLKNLQKFLTP